MKLLSIVVPCYNSEVYMRKCIDSLLIGGAKVEIIIVDDGSQKDRTPQIADEYAKKYPAIVRTIHQENKGHGGSINTGIANATGLYFKVVDSDDWVDAKSYQIILKTLESIIKDTETVDVLFSNYVYEKEGASKKYVMRYFYNFPLNKVFGWKEMKPLGPNYYVLMHSIIYRTALLKESGMELPQHTFYVDNLYAFIPFSFVRTMYYLDVNFYRYYIGRNDQSVNEAVMISRMDQQLLVNNAMIEYMGCQKGLKGRQREFMIHSLSIIMTVSSIMLIRSGTKDSLKKKQQLWEYLKKQDLRIFLKIRWGITGAVMNLPGKRGRKLSEYGYKLVQKVYGFN
ncbi:MAG: glycosyltransferase family 2 protein [Lachnospiraceae bacterium]|nr:glycosyltransferase family 2 protein [Lachnospiraceae bacterium]